jgi:PAX-interacting protein 1
VKYKKAREWSRPVVNAQWLNEILFGHYSSIQQPDMPKFQQFNLGNPFRIEYALIPHLMGELIDVLIKKLLQFDCFC